MKTHNVLVFVVRGQPFTLAHEAVVRTAMDRADQVILLLGSARRPRDLRHPWTWQERMAMISAAFPGARERVICLPMPDYTYRDGAWVSGVYAAVTNAVQTWWGEEAEPKIGLIGHSKDHTSYYLKSFPMWDSIEVPGYTWGASQSALLNATDVRQRFFLYPNERLPKDFVSDGVSDVLESLTDVRLRFAEEILKVAEYRASYGVGPFVTVDAMIRSNRRVLLVKRGKWPGKGEWALPGGFLDPWEPLRHGAIRELGEETKALVSGPPSDVRSFSDPYRDVRAHIVTHVHKWDVPEQLEVQADDDAEDARWFPEAEIQREIMYSDHWHMVQAMLQEAT